MKKLAAILFFCFQITGSADSQTIKGLYVDGFNTILGNTQKEDSLLRYAQYNGYNYLTLYDLWPVHVTYNLTNAASCSVFSDFIQNAKQNYGISQVGAAGENFYFFNNVISVYNQQHSNPLQKLDVYNVEFEFWNTVSVSTGNYYCTTYLQPGGFSCDTAGAFAFYEVLLHEVDSLANQDGVIAETYLGWFNQGQAISIGNKVDRILLHDYISNYSNLYGYIQTRLEYLAGRNIVTEVIPIFSAEPAFMGPWLSANNDSLPFTDLRTALTNEPGSWKQFIHLAGMQWFAYSFMPWNVVQTEIDNPLAINVNVFPNPAIEQVHVRLNTNFEGCVFIQNSIGEILLNEKRIFGKEFTLNTVNFPPGLYEISFLESGKRTETRKIIVRQ